MWYTGRKQKTSSAPRRESPVPLCLKSWLFAFSGQRGSGVNWRVCPLPSVIRQALGGTPVWIPLWSGGLQGGIPCPCDCSPHFSLTLNRNPFFFFFFFFFFWHCSFVGFLGARQINCKAFHLGLIYVVFCAYIFLNWKFSEVEDDI